jgi:hypothetical protein
MGLTKRLNEQAMIWAMTQVFEAKSASNIWVRLEWDVGKMEENG